MTEPLPHEEIAIHTRLLKCALEIEEARAHFRHASPSVQSAFEEYWFGAKSLARVEVLLANLRVRFAAFPTALAVLHAWHDMPPEIRTLVCHWHVQLSEPLYRLFTGQFNVTRDIPPVMSPRRAWRPDRALVPGDVSSLVESSA